MLGGDCKSFGDEIGPGNNLEDWNCSGNRDEFEPFCNGVDWLTRGNKVKSVELDGETVNVDLSERDTDGEGERCSFGVDDLVLANGDASGGNERGDENLGISTWENCGDPLSGFDLWTVWEQLDFCDIEIGFLNDVFEVPLD